MLHRFFLLVCLIIGTTIGAGMLSLPLLCQNLGQLTIFLLFSSGAFIMYCCAHYLIEVSYHHEPGTNLISYLKHSQKELIIPTQIAYLLFLYALLSAYLSALSEATRHLFYNTFLAKVAFSSFLAVFLVLSPLLRAKINGGFVFLMFLALGGLFYLLETPHVPQLLGSPSVLTKPNQAFAVILMSFGFQHIIPSLRAMTPNKKLLKTAVSFSLTFIACIYLYWVNLILSINAENNLSMEHALDFLNYSQGEGSFLDHRQSLIHAFSFLASLTSCIGVCIGLKDFIGDYLGPNYRHHSLRSNLFLTLLTLAPSTVFCLWSTKAFEVILQYSAYLSFFIIIFLPCWLYQKTKVQLHSAFVLALSLLMIFVL